MALRSLYNSLASWSLFDSPKSPPTVTITLTPQIAPPVMLKVPQVTRTIPPPPVKPKAVKPKAVKPKAVKPKAVKPKAAKPKAAKPANKREAIPFEIRDRVWLQYHGAQTKGPCYCCGTVVEKYNGGWHCAHVLSVAKGGTETLENLRTSCGHCNLSMGDQNLYAYIRDHKLPGPGARNVTAYFRKYPSQSQDKRTNNWGK